MTSACIAIPSPSHVANKRLPRWAQAMKSSREAIGVSQEELAIRAEVSQSLVSQIERGVQKPTNVSFDRFSRLLKTLRLTVEEFTELTGLEVEILPRKTEVVRSTRTVPTYHLTVSGDRGGIVATDKRTYIDEDWEGDYEAYILESDDRYQTTVIIRCQNHANKGDEILCETKERGFVVATLAALVGDTYVLKNTEVDFLETRLPTIRGVVVRKQYDRLTAN